MPYLIFTDAEHKMGILLGPLTTYIQDIAMNNWDFLLKIIVAYQMTPILKFYAQFENLTFWGYFWPVTIKKKFLSYTYIY